MTESREIEKAQQILLKLDATTPAAAFEVKDLVRRVLEFANTGKPKGLPGAREMIQGGQTFLVITPEYEVQQAELRKDLTAIIKGELSGPAIARLCKQARHVMIRSYAIERGNLVHKERHFVTDLVPFLADTLLRIRSVGWLLADLKQCRLPGCGRFFLASDLIEDPSAQGRRRERYCSAEHMDQAQTPGAKRTAKWRNKDK